MTYNPYFNQTDYPPPAWVGGNGGGIDDASRRTFWQPESVVSSILTLAHLGLEERYLYPGQSILATESLSIVLEIGDTSLVDADFNYYEPRYHLGTWQRLKSDGKIDSITGLCPTEGFFYHKNNVLEFAWDIPIEPSQQPDPGADGYVSQCNFTLESRQIEIPGGLGTFSTQIQPVHKEVQFLIFTGHERSRGQKVPAGLGCFFAGLGIMCSPGAYLVSIEHRIEARIGIEVSAQRSMDLDLSCDTSLANCEELFKNFLANDPTRRAGVAPDDGVSITQTWSTSGCQPRKYFGVGSGTVYG